MDRNSVPKSRRLGPQTMPVTQEICLVIQLTKLLLSHHIHSTYSKIDFLNVRKWYFNFLKAQSREPTSIKITNIKNASDALSIVVDLKALSLSTSTIVFFIFLSNGTFGITAPKLHD